MADNVRFQLGDQGQGQIPIGAQAVYQDGLRIRGKGSAVYSANTGNVFCEFRSDAGFAGWRRHRSK